MLYSKFFLVLVLLLILKTVAFAQEDFEKWLKRDQAALQKFISEDDKKFANFLKKEWKKYNIQRGLVTDTKPKPPKPPVASPSELPKKKKNVIETNPQPVKVKTPNSITPETSTKKLKLDASKYPVVADLEYYGAGTRFLFPLDIKVEIKGKLDNDAVGNFWEELSGKPYEGLVEQAAQYKNTMRLNDWGYIQLLKKLAEQVYPQNKNAEHLFVWFILIKSGYKTKAGIINNKAYILFPSKNKIYGVPFFSMTSESENFYLLDLDGNRNNPEGALYTYDKDFPGADKTFDMRVLNAPQVNNDFEHRTLSFVYNKSEYKITVRINKSIIEYYKDYPYTELDIYFKAAVSDEILNDLSRQLKPILDGKSEREAANILLAFVQYSFGYKTDKQNFGREKPLFVEETLYYKDSDCEDRSVLFAFLVRNLLGLKVIGIDYPGHVAAAVKFNEKFEGDSLTYKGERFMICDPTYMGAAAGMVIQEYKDAARINNVIEL